jgi:hypothetical protein
MSNGQLFITITNRKITCHSTELWWNNDPAATNAQGARDAAGGQVTLASGGSDSGTSPPQHLKDGSLSPGTYHYTITNWDDSGDSGQAGQDSRIRNCPRPKTSAFIQIDQGKSSGAFELLVPRGTDINDYTHLEETILKGSWKHVHTLKLSKEGAEIQITSVSLIQNTLGGFEALARVSPSQGAGSDYLVAYEFDPESDSPADWQGPIDLFADDGQIHHVTGTPALIQDSEGEFELLVPRGAVTDQYTHEYGSILDEPWHHIQTLTSPDANAQITANWLLQSQSGKLEAIARVSPPAGAGVDYLVGYESDPGAEWKGPVKLVADNGPILAGGKTDIVS